MKTAIVTGGASGIGLQLSISLTKENVYVLVLDLAVDSVFEQALLQEDLEGKQQYLSYQSLDLTQHDQFTETLHSFISKHKRINYFYANAGVTEIPLIDFGAVDKAPNQKTIQVNLIAVLHSIGLVVQQMLAQTPDETGRRGSIVCTSSICGLWPTPGLAMYSASKAGLIAFVESFGAWLPDYDIYLNAVCPGMIATRFGAPVMYKARAKHLTPMEKAVDFMMKCRTTDTSGKAFVVTKDGVGEAPRRPYFDASSQSDISYMEKGMRKEFQSQPRSNIKSRL